MLPRFVAWALGRWWDRPVRNQGNYRRHFPPPLLRFAAQRALHGGAQSLDHDAKPARFECLGGREAETVPVSFVLSGAPALHLSPPFQKHAL